MAIRKKPVTKRKVAAKKKTTGGIAAFVRKIQNSVGVKSVAKTIKALELKLKAAKKKKAAAVKVARKKLK